MNEITTQELMLHVERIVRPIDATQGRKLRMRTELLAHLQAALDEERSHFPGDERAAFERAKLRLGESAQLTRQLQQTVPFLERTLLGRVAVSPRVEQLEQRMSYLPGQRGAMTMGHKTLLSAMALALWLPLLATIYSVVTFSATPPTPSVSFLLGTLIGWPLLLVAFYRFYCFVFEAANPDFNWDWMDLAKRVISVLVLQSVLACFATLACASRAATPGEIVINLISTVVLMVVWLFVARYVGVLRQPYDAWLSLDIAE